MRFEYIEFLSGSVKRGAAGIPKTLNTNILVTNARAGDDVLELEFRYGVEYAPDNGSILMEGRAAFRGKDAEASRKEWEEKGNITGERGEYILNAIYHHASLNAMLISRAFNLAPPVALPSLKIGEAAKKRKGAAPKKRKKRK